MDQSSYAAEGQAVDAFIDRWQGTGGKERANYQLFLTELCQLLDLPGPEPATEKTEDDAYVFERRVDINHPDGSTTRGYIDLYRRGHFVLEAKRVTEKHESSGWDKAMLHPDLTMTGMYNVLEKLRRQEPLNDKEKQIHGQGLVSVLRELHDDLDRAVFQAYGWDDLAEKLVGRPGATTPWPEKPEDQQEAEEELLQRLVDLNHHRAAEEAQGKIRWLRPGYQAPEEKPEQGKLETADRENQPTSQTANQPTKKLTWPKTLQAQIRAVRDQLGTAPMDPTTLASYYKRKPEKSVMQVLEALTELGMVGRNDGVYRLQQE